FARADEEAVGTGKNCRAPLRAGGRHHLQPEGRQNTGDAHRVDYPVPGPQPQHPASRRAALCCMDRKAAHLCRCQSTIRTETPPIPASAALIAGAFRLFSDKEHMATTKSGERKLQILQTLATMLEQ